LVLKEEFAPEVNVKATQYVFMSREQTIGWGKNHNRKIANKSSGPRTQHDYHHDMKVKPETATAVIELLMMGGKAPETC
jgi:hypothetical protein